MKAEQFTKLRGVATADLDSVVATFTEQDWDQLERGYLDSISQDLLDWMDLLGLDTEHDDSTAIFCRLYQLSIARTSEV